MSHQEIRTAAAPSQVWAVLACGESFQDWVAGCQDVRGVDGDWPEPGAAIHHRVGIGFLTLADSTSVEAADVERCLVLRARIRPVGIARVEIALVPDGHGTMITMDERMVEGFAARIPDPVADPLLGLRNRRTLARLRDLADRV